MKYKSLLLYLLFINTTVLFAQDHRYVYPSSVSISNPYVNTLKVQIEENGKVLNEYHIIRPELSANFKFPLSFDNYESTNIIFSYSEECFIDEYNNLLKDFEIFYAVTAIFEELSGACDLNDWKTDSWIDCILSAPLQNDNVRVRDEVYYIISRCEQLLNDPATPKNLITYIDHTYKLCLLTAYISDHSTNTGFVRFGDKAGSMLNRLLSNQIIRQPLSDFIKIGHVPTVILRPGIQFNHEYSFLNGENLSLSKFGFLKRPFYDLHLSFVLDQNIYSGNYPYFSIKYHQSPVLYNDGSDSLFTDSAAISYQSFNPAIGYNYRLKKDKNFMIHGEVGFIQNFRTIYNMQTVDGSPTLNGKIESFKPEKGGMLALNVGTGYYSIVAIKIQVCLAFIPFDINAQYLTKQVYVSAGIEIPLINKKVFEYR